MFRFLLFVYCNFKLIYCCFTQLCSAIRPFGRINVNKIIANRTKAVRTPLKQAVREAATICPRSGLQVDLWPFVLESGVRITCDVGYICANFSLPRPLCSRLMPDVRDRQTDVKQTSDRCQTRISA